jgi:AraC family transcriptional regulator
MRDRQPAVRLGAGGAREHRRDALCTPAEVFTYGGMIAHLLTFSAYRRTMVVLALNAAGIPDLGWGVPMRWVAQPA